VACKARPTQTSIRLAPGPLPPLERLAATVETRWPAIGAYLPLHVTNARTEGYNKIKHIQRVACAFCDQHS
jgi:transposase